MRCRAQVRASAGGSIDELKFDEQFFAVLDFISTGLTLFGMFLFRRFMAEWFIMYVVGALTIARRRRCRFWASFTASITGRPR